MQFDQLKPREINSPIFAAVHESAVDVVDGARSRRRIAVR
jgi:hypothetical protein